MDPGKEVESSCGLASSNSCRAEGGGMCAVKRTARNSRSKMRIRQQNEALSGTATQLDVYTETGRGSEYLDNRQLGRCRISMSITIQPQIQI